MAQMSCKNRLRPACGHLTLKTFMNVFLDIAKVTIKLKPLYFVICETLSEIWLPSSFLIFFCPLQATSQWSLPPGLITAVFHFEL